MIIEIIKEFESEKIKIGHYDIRFLKPLDEKLLHYIFDKYETILTIEDGCIYGGMGSAILEFKNDRLKNKYFGDWSHQKEILDPYQDNMGGKRIGQYIKILLDNFKNKLSSFETITKANNEFSKMWGKDKIIKL